MTLKAADKSGTSRVEKSDAAFSRITLHFGLVKEERVAYGHVRVL